MQVISVYQAHLVMWRKWNWKQDSSLAVFLMGYFHFLLWYFTWGFFYYYYYRHFYLHFLKRSPRCGILKRLYYTGVSSWRWAGINKRPEEERSSKKPWVFQVSSRFFPSLVLYSGPPHTHCHRKCLHKHWVQRVHYRVIVLPLHIWLDLWGKGFDTVGGGEIAEKWLLCEFCSRCSYVNIQVTVCCHLLFELGLNCSELIDPYFLKKVYKTSSESQGDRKNFGQWRRQS